MTFFMEPLVHGGLVAASAAAVVSPLAGAVLCVAVERRSFRLGDQYRAFVFGDLGLAVGIGAGGHALAGADALESVAWTALLAGLVVGVSQAVSDVTAQRYSWLQTLSPTKIWHQMITVPLLSCWLSVSIAAIVSERDRLAAAVWICGVVVWTACMYYDRTRPRSPHVDFYWRRGSGTPTHLSGAAVTATTTQAAASRSGDGGQAASSAATAHPARKARKSIGRNSPMAKPNTVQAITPTTPNTTRVDELDIDADECMESNATSPAKDVIDAITADTAPDTARVRSAAESRRLTSTAVATNSVASSASTPDMTTKKTACHAPATLNAWARVKVHVGGGDGSRNQLNWTSAPIAAPAAAANGPRIPVRRGRLRRRPTSPAVATGRSSASPKEPDRKSGHVCTPGGQGKANHITISTPAPANATTMAASVICTLADTAVDAIALTLPQRRRPMVSLPRRPLGTPPDTVPSYLLRAAVQTRRRVNGAGLGLRIAVTAIVTVSAWWVGPPHVLWAIPCWVGLVLATLEWTERQVDRWSTTGKRPVAWMARRMSAARVRPHASVAGVLESVVGPVLMVAPFAGPFAVPMPNTQRLVSCVCCVLFVASAAVQVVNDASLYDYRERRRMSRVLAVGRVLYPLWNAAVAMALFVSTDRALLSVEQSVAMASILLLIYPLMGLSDAAHLGSTHAYAASVQETLDFVRAAYASDIHRLKSSIRARALFTSSETKAALQDVFLETELIRHLATQGRTVAAVGDALAALEVVIRERSKAVRTVVLADSEVRELVVDPVGLQLLERITVDTVDNSVRSDAKSVTVAVGWSAMTHGRVGIEIDVTDDGSGFAVPDELPFGSSLRQLQRQCVTMGGGLSIESGSAGTTVNATFVVPRMSAEGE